MFKVVKCVDTLGSCVQKGGGSQSQQLIKMSLSHLQSKCKLHDFLVDLKPFPSVSEQSVCCSQLFWRGGLGSAFHAALAFIFFFFPLRRKHERVCACDCFREVKLWRVNSDSMRCVLCDIALMGSACAALSVCIL